MQKETMFAGFGGQGILLMGKVLAQAAMNEGFEVSWVPSYGAEMRGGTAYCTVVVSDKAIGSPVVKKTMNLVAMNEPSFKKFEFNVRENGFIVVNSSLVSSKSNRKDIYELRVPAVEIASEVGTIKTANIIVLSAFVAKTGIVSVDSLKKSVEKEFSKKPKLIPLNMKAISYGLKFVN